MDKKDFDIDEIPKVEIYDDEKESKRKSPLSTYVLIAILVLGGFYLWSENSPSGNIVADITDQELAQQVDKILNNLDEEQKIDDDSDLIVKEFVEGDLVSFPNLEAVDPEGNSVTYTFTSPLDEKGEWQTKKDDVGEYPVTVTISDGENTATQRVLLVIKENNLAHLSVENVNQPVNTPPVITYVDSVEVHEEDVVVLLPEVFDNEGDNATLSFSGWMEGNTRQTSYDDQGTHQVVITASDGNSESNHTVSVVVLNVNRPPVFNSGAFE